METRWESITYPARMTRLYMLWFATLVCLGGMITIFINSFCERKYTVFSIDSSGFQATPHDDRIVQLSTVTMRCFERSIRCAPDGQSSCTRAFWIRIFLGVVPTAAAFEDFVRISLQLRFASRGRFFGVQRVPEWITLTFPFWGVIWLFVCSWKFIYVCHGRSESPKECFCFLLFEVYRGLEVAVRCVGNTLMIGPMWIMRKVRRNRRTRGTELHEQPRRMSDQDTAESVDNKRALEEDQGRPVEFLELGSLAQDEVEHTEEDARPSLFGDDEQEDRGRGYTRRTKRWARS